MNRYQKMFFSLREKSEKAFIPFVTLGDPNISDSFEIVRTLIESGADALELGIPFSDPLADGEIIQNSTVRALKSGVTPDDCFELISKIREEYTEIPIGLLMYANLVFSNGIENFYKKCSQFGVDSVLIADVPLNEAHDFIEASSKNSILQVFVCPPNIDEARIEKLAQLSNGYVYLLSRAGVTGVEREVEMPISNVLELLKKYHSTPPVLGFGISTPDHVKNAIHSGSEGVISGSAIVKIIERNIGSNEKMMTELSSFVKVMKSATKTMM